MRARFLDIALGSLAETKYLLSFAQKLGYFSESDYQELAQASNDLGRKLWKFYEKVRQG
jgi:four helix bundle protein